MQVNLPDLISNIADGPKIYQVMWIMQHVGPRLQGQIMNMHGVASLAYGQGTEISFVCSLTCLSLVVFRTLSITAL